MKIVSRTAKKNPCYQDAKTIRPQGVMIHSIGVPQPAPEVIAANFNQKSADSCVHAVIGAGEEVYQLLPWEYRAWHCGSGPNGSANGTHISFEMSEPKTIRYTKGAVWTDLDPEATKTFVYRTYQRAVAFAAWLCRKYELDPKKDGVLISHSEGHRRGIASAHADVEHIWDKEGLSMEQFRQDVAKQMQRDAQGGTDGAGGNADAGSANGAGGDIDAGTEKMKYIVQAGAFADRANAQKLVKALQAAGFSSYIKEI